MSEKELSSEGLVYLRKVLITPLRVLPYPEIIEESNRIIRQCAFLCLDAVRVAVNR